MSKNQHNKPSNQQATNQPPQQETPVETQQDSKVEVTEEINTTEIPVVEANQASQATEQTKVEAPVKPTPVPQPANRPQAPVKTIVPVAVEQTVSSITTVANEKGDLRMQTLIQTLETLEKNLSRRVQINMDDVAKNMVGLHNCLLNVINGNKTNAEFKQQWELVLKFFEEKKDDGFGMNRLYRGVAFWPKSQDEYVHFQSLVNLIYVTNNVARENWQKELNFTRLTNHPVTEAGRGRLLSYYL